MWHLHKFSYKYENHTETVKCTRCGIGRWDNRVRRRPRLISIINPNNFYSIALIAQIKQDYLTRQIEYLETIEKELG